MADRTLSAAVQTTYGEVLGRQTGRVFCWLGIPYGQASRFRPPEHAAPWSGTLNAFHYGNIAPQHFRRRKPRSEDCLNLNIWSPEADGKKRPVIFYIHGGSFICGAGSDAVYNGRNLAETWDVVVVTLNYRLGVLGFLDFSFLNTQFSPNCGIRDVLLALEWVHGNISAFGGDPGNITVMGQSAGGIITSILSVNPQAQKYLSKCIIMSGGPTHLQSRESCRSISRSFLTYTGLTSDTLASIPVHELMRLQKQFMKWYGLGAATFRPMRDHHLIPQYPVPAALKGAAEGIPILIGTTKEEMSFLLIKPLPNLIDVQRVLEEGSGDESDEMRQVIREKYIRRYGKRQGWSLLYADMLFRISCVWFAEACSRYSPVWMYRFDYETPAMKAIKLHSMHSSDIPYAFGNLSAPRALPMFLLNPGSREAASVSREFQEDIIGFARTGKLPWEPCSVSHAPAKCYGSTSWIEPAIDPDIKEKFDATDYRKRSFRADADTSPSSFGQE